jgi:predicted CoA-substrate-specific enzyme activase
VKKETCFLGIDLGSSYTKLTVINDSDDIIHQAHMTSLSRDQSPLKNLLKSLRSNLNIMYSCSTGYGRKHFNFTEIDKTEIITAAEGVSKYLPGVKNIIDIGGEDIKVIICNKNDKIENFYLNEKCSAGTGSFITEISKNAEIDVKDMSRLASKSKSNQELNSVCTVFAKTEILRWLFSGVPIEDVARGIYLAVANKITKLRVDKNKRICIIGGVIKYHPYIKNILDNIFDQIIQVIPGPQYIVSLGAASIAKKSYYSKQ